MPVKILIADDHAVVREGLTRILGQELGEVSVDGVGTAREAVELLREELSSQEPYELVIVDIGLPDASGLELLKQLRSLSTSVPILVLSVHQEDFFALRALKSGADGYLTKSTAPGEMVRAVRKVTSGGKYVGEALAERMFGNIANLSVEAPHHLLSDKELEVLCRIAGGKRITDVATEMSLSVKTISTHRTRILKKLNLSSNAELIKYALENHLVN